MVAGETATSQEVAVSPVKFLLVDDQGPRRTLFEKMIRKPGELTFETVDDPPGLLDHDLDSFEGAIVDFHLDTSLSQSYKPLLYENPDILEAPVEIRTGLGVMLYLQKRRPDMTLYGFTELAQYHAQLFLAAASLWLGAEPINADENPRILQDILLEREDREKQAAYRRMTNATDPFKKLMDSCLHRNPPEAYDWLRCYRECSGPKPHTALADVMVKKLGREKMGRRKDVDATHTYVPMMIRWQETLAEFVQAWGGDTSQWPDITGTVSQRAWEKQNPVLEYIGKYQYGTFFNAADVRAALTYYRSRSADWGRAL